MVYARVFSCIRSPKICFLTVLSLCSKNRFQLSPYLFCMLPERSCFTYLKCVLPESPTHVQTFFKNLVDNMGYLPSRKCSPPENIPGSVRQSQGRFATLSGSVRHRRSGGQFTTYLKKILLD